MAESELAEKLLRAHLAHELNLFQDDKLKTVLDRELPAVHDWVAARTPRELAPPDEVKAFARRALIESKPSEASVDFGLSAARAAMESLRDRKEQGADVLSREAYDRLVEILGADEKLRRAGVHVMVNNAVFAMVVSETMYRGIEDFISQSKLTQTIPGAQSLFKLGQDMLNQAVPGLKDNIEKNIKDFIKNNAGNIIKNSEEFLNQSLGPETIKEAADQLWNDTAKRPVSEIPDFVSADGLGARAEIARKFVERFRATPLFADLIDVYLNHYYEAYGDKPMGATLEMLGITKELFVNEAVAPILNLARLARESGYLEGLIERRLRDFYESPEAIEILNGQT